MPEIPVPAAGPASARNQQHLAQRGLDLSVVQPLYSGGRTQAGTKRAEALVEAQRADLLSTEQSVLLDGATAYLDVVRDQAVVDLNVNNEQVLRRQLDASRDRFNVGEITRTDVSQAESRLARAISDRIQAEGQLSGSRADLRPRDRISARPADGAASGFDLPSSREETVALAESNNPTVIAAEFSESAARNAVDAVRGEMLPSANLRGTLSRIYEPSSRPTARTALRSRRPSRSRCIRRVRSSCVSVKRGRRGAAPHPDRGVAPAGGRERDSRLGGPDDGPRHDRIRQSQVRASEIALEGVRQEALVGSRTTLDTLDSEQELLDARVQLVQAQRNEMVAAFSVLSATGQLSARQLGLKVPFYDHKKHYKQVRGKWWGTDIDE